MARITVGAFLIFLFCGLASVDTRAQSGWGFGSWQAIGATGVADASSQSKIDVSDNGWVHIKPTISTSAKLRFNIPPLEGLRGVDPPHAPYELHVRVRDNGPLARVVVRVKQMNWSDGTVRTLAQFDSDQWEFRADGEGVMEVWGPGLSDESGPMWHFRPAGHVYWAEVHLVKNGAGGNPGIAALGVFIDQ